MLSPEGDSCLRTLVHWLKLRWPPETDDVETSLTAVAKIWVPDRDVSSFWVKLVITLSWDQDHKLVLSPEPDDQEGVP